MAWGMYLPRSGGPYGPHGELEGRVDRYSNGSNGWQKRLLEYYQNQMPEPQKRFYGSRYAYCVYEKLVYKCGDKRPGSDNLMVKPIEDHEPPTFFQIGEGYNQLASIINLGNRIWAVDENVKRIAEQLEPGLHGFYPLEIRMPRSRVYPVPYYVFVTGTWIESFSPQDSSEDSVRLRQGRSELNWFSVHSKKGISGFALRESVHAGAHLWRERSIGEWLICFSDAFAVKLAASQLMLPKYYRMKSI